MGEYYTNVALSNQQIRKDWEIFRASCLSNINDIILTLGLHSNGYIFQIIDIALGILQHEHENSIILRRSALYVLHTIVYLNASCVDFGANISNKKLLNQKLQYIHTVLENLLVNGCIQVYDGKIDDAVCKHHIQCCLSLYSCNVHKMY